ncbi:hypothetical protein NEIMUCOT_04452 [Neisseria mucosa ATCC 25996]|uniref:Uncharacterized protein n=1 Tax=Neisseria mucosa (strain ATCC 25996 / DSM 4631 / NCTC 10774 / M26) TaxID=546266 RepID=D2ZV11_NEIM2|nr:hypothetical protein NEIMUCOT_04452 [Neisseria mucosa ATCC 25996]
MWVLIPAIFSDDLFTFVGILPLWAWRLGIWGRLKPEMLSFPSTIRRNGI